VGGHSKAIIEVVLEMFKMEELPATPDAIKKFIKRSVAQMPSGRLKNAAAKRMQAGLVVDPAHDDTADIAKVWSDCQSSPTSTMPQEKFDQEHAELLRSLVCNATENRTAIAAGIARNWINASPDRQAFSAQLARGLLSEDGSICAATKDFDKPTIDKLRQAAALAVPTSAASK
jgi:hypothetical protein